MTPRNKGWREVRRERPGSYWWTAIGGMLAAAVLGLGWLTMGSASRVAATDDEGAPNAAPNVETDAKIYWQKDDKPVDLAGTPQDESNPNLEPAPAVPATPKTGDGNDEWHGSGRVFPGLRYYAEANDSEGVPYADRRRRVLAVVEWVKGNAPAEVHFRLWDVDDPSDNDGPIDSDTHGADNKDATGGHFAGEDGSHIVTVHKGKVLRFKKGGGTEETDAQANCYKVETVVGMRPGDNYRFAASTDKQELVAMTQAMADNVQRTATGRISKILTVWRKLHIEFDAMRAPSKDTHEPFGVVSGTSSSIESTLLIAQSMPGWPSGALVGGVLDPQSATPGIAVDYVNHHTWEVLANGGLLVNAKTDYRGDKFDTGPPPADDPSEVYTMTPEDPSNKPFGINTDDPAWRTDLLVPQPSEVLPGMNHYYHDAYIDCVEQTEGNQNAEFDWIRMTSDQLAHVDVPGGPAYWTACVGWGYESEPMKTNLCGNCTGHSFYLCDDDPELEGVPSGHQAAQYGVSRKVEDRCMVWVEVCRDTGGRSVARTAAHEVGHLFGLNHAKYDGSWETWEPDLDKDGIMSWDKPRSMSCSKQWYDLTGPPPDRFSYENIKYLRESATD